MISRDQIQITVRTADNFGVPAELIHAKLQIACKQVVNYPMADDMLLLIEYEAKQRIMHRIYGDLLSRLIKIAMMTEDGSLFEKSKMRTSLAQLIFELNYLIYAETEEVAK